MPIFVIDRYLVSNVCGITPFVCVFFFLFNILRQTMRRFAREIEEYGEQRRLILHMLLNAWFVKYAPKVRS